jgi:Ca2+-binding RTX toxin-like protein
VINAGGGTNIVDAGAGNDVLIYVAAENGTIGANDLYVGGAGSDTLQLVLTRAEWMRADIQADVANYLAFLDASSGASGADNNASFTFSVFPLTARKMEKLAVTVDGVAVDPVNHVPVITTADLSGSIFVSLPIHRPLALRIWRQAIIW